MANITDPIPITQDVSHVGRALNDQHGVNRGPALLSAVAVSTFPLVGSSPYLKPRLQVAGGGAGVAKFFDSGGPAAGKLWFVTAGKITHNDPVARDSRFIIQLTIAGSAYEIEVQGATALPTNAAAFLSKTIVLNEGMKLGYNVIGLAAGQQGSIQYLAYEVDVGESPDPMV